MSFIDSGYSSRAAWLEATSRAQAGESRASSGPASASPPAARRPPGVGSGSVAPGWTEVFLCDEAGICSSTPAAVAAGHSVL
eukprot:5447175-Prymnesium_polylepis.1